ncbi:MAG: dihydrofolate reductase [Candidatus Gracilibacteria bacterium]|jgi:dihydrofolate reductase
MIFALIAAADKNLGIGIKGRLPWKLRKDMQFFQKTTIGEGANAVVMGRATWESLPQAHKPLKSRLNIILTRDEIAATPEGAFMARSIDEALKIAERNNCERVFIIGGAKTYEQAINHPECREIFLTEIDAQVECDTFFPKIDTTKFKKISESEVEEENGLRFSFVRYGKI